jgi:hypothetical protein
MIIIFFKYLSNLTNTNGPLFTRRNDQSNDFYFVNKKDHLSHIKHVKTDLSKMTKGLFGLFTNMVFLSKKLVWKTKNSSSGYI